MKLARVSEALNLTRLIPRTAQKEKDDWPGLLAPICPY